MALQLSLSRTRLNTLMARKLFVLLLFLWLFSSITHARNGFEDYALILEAPPVAQQTTSRNALHALEAQKLLRGIRTAQSGLREELARRNIRVTGSVQTLLNAVFVQVSRERVAELRGLRGVRRVAWLPPVHRHLYRALDLVQAPEAWNAVGGPGNAGTGVMIGILDSGIDQNHPGFQDDSLPMPPGFPKGRQAFTNTKVIVARSYVDLLPNPDDISPRDRSGHGTAIAMIAAGVPHSAPLAAISGVAPKAYLGNYKIFGSTGINDTTRAPVVLQALEDAFNDGMHIVTLPLGDPAVYGPLDRDPACSLDGTLADCDVRAQAVENAVRNGLTVVVSAGNDAETGLQFATLNTINTPGTAPSAITVGASTNSHVFFASLRVTGDGVPSDLQNVQALFGDGPKPNGVLTAPVRDVSRLENDGRACSPLSAGSLTGAMALIQRGDCSFAEKVKNAEDAGAVGVLIYQVDGVNLIFNPLGLTGSGIPAAMIGNTAGVALKNFLQANPDQPVTLDPALQAVDAATFNTVADFSSRGPSIGDSSIKPELVAVGTQLYTATQQLDPSGDLYDSSGYTAVSGTSFAAAVVAGAAALVKQNHPDFNAAQIKSALVNTATGDVTDDTGPARVTAVGGGKLNAAAAVSTGATVEPATLSFGVLSQTTLPVNLSLRVTNTGSSAGTFNLAVAPRDQDNDAQLSLSASSLTLNPGQQGTVNAQLQGNLPAPGSYEGFITIDNNNDTRVRVPYLYLVSDGVPYNIFPLINANFVGLVNDPDPFLVGFKLIDRYGVPLANVPVQFQVVSGGGSIGSADAQTDRLGIAAALVSLGPQEGDQVFTAQAGGLTVEFDGFALQASNMSTQPPEPLARARVIPSVAIGRRPVTFPSRAR